LRVGAGFGAALRQRLGGVHGCTHLLELFGQLATTAIQTILARRRSLPDASAASSSPPIDTCHAMPATCEVVAKYWPRLHRSTE
ncbi:MAG TPA: DUF2889 domain-containing protein, partial [Rhodopila sp.]